MQADKTPSSEPDPKAEPSKRSTAELVEELYETLKRLAESQLKREAPGATLQPTMLVHEAYLRLCSGGNASHWDSAGHFYASAARAMRRVLIDRARARDAVKRGGEWVRDTVDINELVGKSTPIDAVALGEALDALQSYDERKARIVEMKFFAGLSIDEIAEGLGVSESSVKRDWKFARAWLLRHLEGQT